MLRWAKSGPCFRCGAGLILHRRSWPRACVQSFVSPFASSASRHHDHALTLKLSASKASRFHGHASVSESKLHSRSASDTRSDAKISVLNASCQDVDANKALAWSHHDPKRHFVDGNVPVSGFAAHMPHAQAHFSNGDVRGAETFASCCATQSPHVSLQTLLTQTEKESQQVLADLQQKIELLESEQFSLSEARRLLKTKAFNSCSVEQLATALQELKKYFSCAELLRLIVVRSSNVLLQPTVLVQKKLELLRGFQLEEKVVTKLCGKGGVLSVSMDSLQKKLMFFNNIGLTVAARNRMFWRGPRILQLRIENSIQPPLKFLESKGFTKANVVRTAQCCPHIFCMSMDSLMKKYDYVKQLGFSVDKFPVVLFDRRAVINNIKEHLQTFRDLGFTDDDVQLMIHCQPAVLLLSSENLKCKVDFLISKQHRKLAEIVRFPPCLMYSLQARLIPRFSVINDLGLSRVYTLNHILSPTNSRFAELFKKAGNTDLERSAGNLLL